MKQVTLITVMTGQIDCHTEHLICHKQSRYIFKLAKCYLEYQQINLKESSRQCHGILNLSPHFIMINIKSKISGNNNRNNLQGKY